MGGKVNAGLGVQFRIVGLTNVGEREHVERSLRLPSSCSMASSTLLTQDIGSISDIMGEEETGSGDTSTATNDMNTPYDEAGLIRDSLQDLSFESGGGADSAPEGIVAGENEQKGGFQDIKNGVPSSAPKSSNRPESTADVDYVMTLQPHGHGYAVPYGDNPLAPRGLTHEYRPPPALHLPDQTIMGSEFGELHQDSESDYSPSNFRLPASLVGSPSCNAPCLDGKASLDPNAKEYTPAPSPCISPGMPQSALQQHIGVPSSYSFESGHIFVAGLDNRSMIFRPSYGSNSAMSIYGSDSSMSIYQNGSQLAYAAGSVTPAAWASTEVSDLSGHEVAFSAGDNLPVTHSGVAQSHPLSLPLRSIGIPPFQTFRLPPVGISVHNDLPHPPISGREHVSRAILLNGVPTSLTDEQLKIEMGKWGDVRTVVSDRKHQGLVTVNFYDLRCAKEALRDIQQQHLNKQQRMQQQFQRSHKQRGTPMSCISRQHVDPAHVRQDTAMSSELQAQCNGISFIAATPGKGLVNGIVMWAQYTLPIGAGAGADGLNQGTLVVFNLDGDTTMEHLKSVFEVYGDVKELRETPAKKQHKFVEFYDVRDASKALKALDGTEINGKRVKIEFSRPGGQAHRARAQLQHQEPAVYQPLNGTRTALVGSGPSAVAGQPFYMNWSGDAAGTPLRMAGPHGGTSYLWASSIGTPVSPLGLSLPQPWNSGCSQLSNFDYAPMQAGPSSSAGPLVVMGNMEALSFGRVGRRAMPLPSNVGSVSPTESFSSGHSGRGSGTVGGYGRGEGVSSRRKRNSAVSAVAGYGKVDPANNPGSGSRLREGPRVGTRISTNKLSARQDIPPQYVFDEAGAEADETQRTTLMIKNIPNKYSQQMLLSLLDNHCMEWNKRAEGLKEPDSAYDFVYLPIDFKNRCNLGYAFVNFTSVQATTRLYRDFHLQQWEEFNSRKVCHVTYARVQGRLALEEHFKNSRFACDTDDYLPLIFRPPRNGMNTSIPATVAAVHQLSRVLGISLEDSGKGLRNGERNGDDFSKRALQIGVSCSGQEFEIDMSTGQSGCSSMGVHRSTMPQQHR